ncbi:MAG: hypothetical protein MUC43_19285 [Pirellula sp.]|nr:hypothetical protein [Pirellula sp.]
MINQKSLYLSLLMLCSLGTYLVSQSPTGETKDQRRERLRMSVQAICPVTGESLSLESKPIKLVNPETKEVLYVCCEECSKAKPEDKHLEKIRSHFAKAQAHCLVMTDNEISPESKIGIVEGHAVFVCCPPCTKKMQASPEKFLKKLDDLYEAYLKK